MKIATFLITALVNAAVSFVMFFMLLLGLNGFSGDQAEPGLILYIVWSFLSAIITGVSGIWLANYLATKKSMNKIAATMVSSLIFIAVGVVSVIVSFFAAVILTSAMR
ncbi:MAG TPA: hypothetical protein VGB68_17445 [Pyrinomonadaceae bacterium]|jgi:hypothetical protein